MPRRAEPERTCVGCRQKAPKRELIRLARPADGPIRLDPTGKAPGRGAYVHRDPGCVQGAVRRGALARALRASIAPDELGRLIADIEGVSET